MCPTRTPRPSSMGRMTLLDETALVFEGGGMRASNTAGVVAMLLEEELAFPHAFGISAGVTHAFNYASRDAWRARNAFTSFVEDPDFGGPRCFAEGKGWFNADYIYGEACQPDGPFRFLFQDFLDSPTDATISAFCVETGEPSYWSKADMPTLDRSLLMARASGTMPGFMPPVELDGLTWVDGALGPSGGIPLEAAIDKGFERFVVVMTRPRSYVKARPNPAPLRALFRDMPHVADALADRWLCYNRTRERLFELEESGRALLFFAEGAETAISNRELNLDKLIASYEAGYVQALEWKERLFEFVA